MLRGVKETMARLRSLAEQPAASRLNIPGRLDELLAFGDNPGALGAYCYIPDGARALVVVLHGCTQTAEGYDQGAGWSILAERFGFALLFPEQRRPNNPNLCFNWFRPNDSRRGQGETLSIRQMIATMIERHRLDSSRVYITGLSAGGAMSSVMLACYPEVFAGGAIIAGLPFGAATSIPQAFDRMRGQGHASGDAYSKLIRSASNHSARWPRIAVWHGSADATVSSINADAIIAQWRSIHGVGAEPDRTDLVDGVPHRQWLDRLGRVAIEDYRIEGMGHGTPLRTEGQDGYGTAMSFMLDVGISSTWHIANSWDLLGEERLAAEGLPKSNVISLPDAPRSRLRPEHERKSALARSDRIRATIESALRQTGLMR